MPGPSDLLILCYHAVSAGWPTDFAVSPESLRRQVGGLLRRGYSPMTLSAALGSGGSARKALVVTFDDAYRSVLEAGLPVLASLGAPATVFAPTSFVGSGRRMVWAEMAKWEGTEFQPELDPMSWEELRRLVGEGWEIGSHSRSHADLVSLEGDRLAAELRDSRSECEAELGTPCRTLAYPFSSYDGRVKGAARAAGYEAAVILDNHLAIPPGSVVRSGGHRTDPFELLRTGVYRHDGRLRLAAKNSRAARRLRASAAWRNAVEALPQR